MCILSENYEEYAKTLIVKYKEKGVNSGVYMYPTFGNLNIKECGRFLPRLLTLMVSK